MSEIEIMRAHALAQGAKEVRWLFWVVLIGALIIIAFWSIVHWHLRRQAARVSSEMFRSETRRHAAPAPNYSELD